MADETVGPKRTTTARIDTQSVLGGAVTLAVRTGYLQVTFSRSAQTMSEFEAVRSAVDLTLRMNRLRRVLFDVRVADKSPDEVRKKIWDWISVSGPFERVAFVTDNDMLVITINMTGVKSSRATRAFVDTTQAITWLSK